MVRESSWYHADRYRFPLTIFTLPDGRTGLVSSPQHYNRLEVEIARSGERLTEWDGRDPSDFFHSRPSVSDDGRLLLSAGWVGQPWGCLAAYDPHRALSVPARLDDPGNFVHRAGLVQAEIAGAWSVEQDILISTSAEPNDPESPDDLAPEMLARWSTAQERFTWKRQLSHTAGDLLPIGAAVLALHEHPHLFDSRDGELLEGWPDIDTGRADSAIVGGGLHRAGPRRRGCGPSPVRGDRRPANHDHHAGSSVSIGGLRRV